MSNVVALQVWKKVDQGGADQRETDGGSAHWNTLGVCNLYRFRQRQTNFLQHLTRRYCMDTPHIQISEACLFTVVGCVFQQENWL